MPGIEWLCCSPTATTTTHATTNNNQPGWRSSSRGSGATSETKDPHVPHSCHCGQDVDAWGLHAFVCKHAPSRIQQHHVLNDIIAHACASAGVPVSKEPSGLFPDDIRRPHGLTLIPWQAGKADSYIHSSVCHYSWSGDRVSSSKQSLKIIWPTILLFVSASCSGNSGSNQWVSYSVYWGLGPQNLNHFQQGVRESIFVSAAVGPSAAFQYLFVTVFVQATHRTSGHPSSFFMFSLV